MASRFYQSINTRFMRFGIPFIVLLVGGSFGLKQFTKLRYQFRNHEVLSYEEAEELGIKMKKEEEKPTLEMEYKKLQEIDIDTWQNIRGPRPWEDSKTVQNELREAHSSS